MTLCPKQRWGARRAEQSREQAGGPAALLTVTAGHGRARERTPPHAQRPPQ